MVYMEPTALGIEPLLTSWLADLPPGVVEHADLLRDIFNATVPEGLRFLRRNLKVGFWGWCAYVRVYMCACAHACAGLAKVAAQPG